MLKISKDNSGWKVAGVQQVGEQFGYNGNGQQWIRFECFDHRRDKGSVCLQLKIPVYELWKQNLATSNKVNLLCNERSFSEFLRKLKCDKRILFQNCRTLIMPFRIYVE